MPPVVAAGRTGLDTPIRRQTNDAGARRRLRRARRRRDPKDRPSDANVSFGRCFPKAREGAGRSVAAPRSREANERRLARRASACFVRGGRARRVAAGAAATASANGDVRRRSFAEAPTRASHHHTRSGCGPFVRPPSRHGTRTRRHPSAIPRCRDTDSGHSRQEPNARCRASDHDNQNTLENTKKRLRPPKTVRKRFARRSRRREYA